MTKFGYKQTAEHKEKNRLSSIGQIRSAEYRLNISLAKKGKKNGMYKENAGYMAIHNWLRNNYSKPKNCEYCKLEKKLDWASKTKEYKRNRDEFIALCRSCHIKLDRYKSIAL